eukprot:scaffold68442_cov36-Tisochrysis_lutea.AAC.2
MHTRATIASRGGGGIKGSLEVSFSLLPPLPCPPLPFFLEDGTASAAADCLERLGLSALICLMAALACSLNATCHSGVAPTPQTRCKGARPSSSSVLTGARAATRASAAPGLWVRQAI